MSIILPISPVGAMCPYPMSVMVVTVKMRAELKVQRR